jgi:hypothetical protein
MALKFRRGTTAQQSGSLVFGEPYVNTTLGTLLVGGATGDIQLATIGTGSAGTFGGISGSSLDITGNAKIDGNLILGGNITIGDQTTDSVVINADLSSSIIPDITNTFDLGSATKVWRDLYVSTGSIKFVAGTTVVKELSLATLTALESATGSTNTFTASVTPRLTNLETTSASVNSVVTNINTFTASNANTSLNAATASFSPRITNLETTSASVNGYIADNNSKTGSYARTNVVNTFTSNQIISGTLSVTQDLIVLGSSSIQNISSSNLVIGTSFVTLNTFSPSSRFSGLRIVDSGSAGSSGSLLYDSVEDEFLFVHKGNGTNVTSSHFITGPETYDNLGNETYLTTNRLPKASGKEHIVDSNITDTGTLITLGSNTVVNGTLLASGTALVSGSSQITFSGINSLPTLVSGSSQITLSSTTGYGTVINQNLLTTSDVTHNSITAQIRATNGVVSGSSQITYASISSIPAGIVSGSSQVTGIGNAQLTNSSITIAGQSTALGSSVSAETIRTAIGTVVSGSSQITYASISSIPAGIVSGSAQTIANLPTGTVSGSSQVTLSSTTGYGTVINQNLLTTSDVRHNSLGIGMAASATAGRIDASGDIIAFSTSDKNFKENITPIPNALEKISKISGNIYDWKSELKEYHGFEGNDVGVIAQEIEEVLPQLVQTRENGYKAVKYDKLVALLIEGIKEQQIQINELKAQIGSK